MRSYAYPSKVGEMLSSNIAKVRWSWSFNRDRITGKHLSISAIISWPEHCQQRRSMPVTLSLRYWIGAQHFVGKTNRSPNCTLKQLRSDLPLRSKPFFFTLKLSFHPHIARFRQHSRGNGACAHYVMVSKFQWKPFWLATQRDLQNDWTATQNRVNYDVFAQAPSTTGDNEGDRNRLIDRGPW